MSRLGPWRHPAGGIVWWTWTGTTWEATVEQTELVLRPKQMGATFDPALDTDRLTTLLKRVYGALEGGAWLTLGELYIKCGGSEAGISARIRQLRKLGFVVERRRRGGPRRGWHEYRLVGRAPA